MLGFVSVPDASLSPGVLEIDFDPGFGVTGAIGGYLYDHVRGELEISYFNAGIDDISGVSASGSVDATSAMINMFYDFGHHFNISRVWHPYAGAGLGITGTDLDVDTVGGLVCGCEGDDTVFSYQVIAGIGYDLSPAYMITSDYRYFGTEDPNYDGVKAELSAHKFSVGMRYKF